MVSSSRADSHVGASERPSLGLGKLDVLGDAAASPTPSSLPAAESKPSSEAQPPAEAQALPEAPPLSTLRFFPGRSPPSTPSPPLSLSLNSMASPTGITRLRLHGTGRSLLVFFLSIRTPTTLQLNLLIFHENTMQKSMTPTSLPGENRKKGKGRNQFFTIFVIPVIVVLKIKKSMINICLNIQNALK